MATTGIWKIEKRLDNVLDYTTNVEKTKHNEKTTVDRRRAFGVFKR